MLYNIRFGKEIISGGNRLLKPNIRVTCWTNKQLTITAQAETKTIDCNSLRDNIAKQTDCDNNKNRKKKTNLLHIQVRVEWFFPIYRSVLQSTIVCNLSTCC